MTEQGSVIRFLESVGEVAMADSCEQNGLDWDKYILYVFPLGQSCLTGSVHTCACACANANGRTGAEYLQHCPRPKTRKG